MMAPRAVPAVAVPNEVTRDQELQGVVLLLVVVTEGAGLKCGGG